MVNVTTYVREIDGPRSRLIQNFLRMERVKYLIATGEQVSSKRGRYGGTLFSEGLFEVFKQWMRREPIPLLNRKEYEVSQFLQTLFGESLERQFELDGFVYDWYAPSHDLLIEFNEKEHSRRSRTIERDSKKARPNLFVINEVSAMQDLARLSQTIKA